MKVMNKLYNIILIHVIFHISDEIWTQTKHIYIPNIYTPQEFEEMTAVLN